MVVLAYWPAAHAGFVWDDDHMLTANALVQSPHGLHLFWFTRAAPDYWPVTSTSLWLEWRLWGPDPMGYHLTNIVLHLADVLILWRLLVRLRMPGAWWAAALFAVHPLNVESVTWIAQRKNVLAMLFYLLAIAGFVRAESLGEPAPAPAPSRWWYWLSLMAFVAALLSKGSVATLPLVLMGLVAWHRRLTRRDLGRLAPFFAVALVLAAVDVWFQKHGLPEVFRTAGFPERLVGAGAIVAFYLAKALWPARLTFIYPLWHIHLDQVRWWLPLLAVLALTGLLLGWTRRPRATAAAARASLYAWVYFCVSLLPVVGFTDVYFMKYSLVANHYAHLALIGVTAWAGWLIHQGGAGAGRARHLAVAAAATSVLGLLTALTWQQNEQFRDGPTLYRAMLRLDPQSWMAHNNLAYELAKTPAGAAEAIAHFEEAIRLKPDYAPAHNDLAILLAQVPGRLPDALAHYETALRLNPNFFEAHDNFAIALATIPGRLPEAVAQYEAALRLDPRDPEVRCNLAVALAKLPGRSREAEQQFQGSLALDPADADTHYDYANLLFRMPDRLADAVAQYEEAVRLRPDFTSAHYNLAVAYARNGQRGAAMQQLERVLALDPGNRAAHANLALLQAGP